MHDRKGYVLRIQDPEGGEVDGASTEVRRAADAVPVVDLEFAFRSDSRAHDGFKALVPLGVYSSGSISAPNRDRQDGPRGKEGTYFLIVSDLNTLCPLSVKVILG